MKKILFLSFVLVVSQLTKAQTAFSFGQSEVFSTKPVVVNMAKQDINWVVSVKKQHSKHGNLIDLRKADVDKKAHEYFMSKPANKRIRKTFTPDVTESFVANFTNGTPADNNMAISNDGKIISAVNSNVRFYEEDGTFLGLRTLASIARDAGNFSSSAYDPHTIYDPEEDRFILIFLSGYSSNNTNMVVGFSQTNDPMDDWNFYKLPGNVHGDNTWSDYPFMGITHDELFIPVLLWQNGESGWDSEAQDIIWQIDKKAGYAGEKLDYKYYDKIKVGNRLVWNTRPVWGSEKPYGPNMYFLANRAIDLENDSFFLFEITNTLASGKAELKMKVVRATDNPYSIPPSAKQPLAGDSLRTNYADVHGALLHYGKIHFVMNGGHPTEKKPAIYYGEISNLNNDEPSIKTDWFVNENLDLNYPNIAYAGGGGIDRSFVVNCLHSSSSTNPGSSVFFVDRNGDFSELVVVKEGDGPINVLRGDQERWGDYTGAQRKYNESGVTWFMGSFGSTNNAMDSWLARVQNTDPQLGTNAHNGFTTKLFPNPASESVTVNIEIHGTGNAALSILDIKGREVKKLKNEYFENGVYVVSIDISELETGTYILKCKLDDELVTKRFVKE